MKFISLFLAILATCIAWAAPVADKDLDQHLAARDNNDPNPDGETKYTDVLTGNEIDKSRILVGIDPPEAKQRFFDWDESCSNKDHRTKILSAWRNMQQLAKNAGVLLEKLGANLPKPVGTLRSPNLENVKFIFAEDPAYAQMFAAKDAGISDVRAAYTSILNIVQKVPQDRGTDAALRFICNEDDHVLDGNGASYCGTGTGAAQALTLSPQDPSGRAIEERYRFQYSSSITFCPAFFHDFPLLVEIDLNTDHTLDKVDCADRIMLHEYLHLPFTQDMAPRTDYIGWRNCADFANTPSRAWGDIKNMPDNYAWYALYASMNNYYKGCGPDAWPPGAPKAKDPPA